MYSILSLRASRRAILAVTTVAVAVSTFALADEPSGHAIVARFVEVSGGAAAYSKIQNRVVEAAVSLPDHGMEGEMSETFSPPDHRLVMTIDVYDEMVSGVTKGVAWVVHPMDGSEILGGHSEAAAKRQAQLNPFLDWTAASGEAKVVGTLKVGGEDCYRVELRPKEDSLITAYFGKESGLLRKTDDRTAGVFRFYDDYRELDGVLVPYKTRFEVGMMNADMTIVNIEQNVDLHEDTFDLPPHIEAMVKKSDELKARESVVQD